MNSKQIKKYEKKTLAQLKKQAQIVFNKYIRERDKHLMCISCQKGRVEQAGHFYSAGHYQALRYNEDNTHGQCVRCNHFLSGNLNNYRINLEKRIGKDRLELLDSLANRKAHRWDRFELIEIIENYKIKTT